MRISTNALAAALAGFLMSTTASAQTDDEIKGTKNTQTSIRGQSGSASSKSQEEEAAKQEADKLSTGKQLDLSKEARNAIVELQTAVNANDVANIPAKLAAAQAVAKTNDDKYVIAVLQTRAATAAGDLAGMRAGIDALKASGGGQPGEVVSRYNDLAKRHYDAKQFDQAASALEAALALDANNINTLKLLASTRESQNRDAEAVDLMLKSFAAAKAAGQKPQENSYKFAARLAYDAKSPAATEVTRAWLADYPNPTNWRDGLRIYRDVNGLQGDAKIDVLRLARATNALVGESDYFAYVSELVTRGFLNEAKAVIDEAGAAKAIDVNKHAFKQFAPKLAKAPSRTMIDNAAKKALAGGSARDAMDAGDALYGVGAYAEAAPLYKAAAAKGGADANLANLRYGMALARSGDKAGAAAALNSVTGSLAPIAKYWLVWVNNQA